MNERNPMLCEPFQVRFASSPHQVVHRHHAMVLLAHPYRKFRPDKSSPPGNQNMHVVTLLPPTARSLISHSTQATTENRDKEDTRARVHREEGVRIAGRAGRC